jgi:hypothetical protein
MAQIGLKLNVNYIGLGASLASLKAELAYDQTIGMVQGINIKNAVENTTDGLSGNSLVTFVTTLGGTLVTDCGLVPATATNAQLLSCIVANIKTYPNYVIYLYDEPVCPNQSIGECLGSMAGDNYGNVAEVASYMQGIDPSHAIFGVNVGAPAQSDTNTEDGWLVNATTPIAGFDWYPVGWPQHPTFTIDNIGQIATNFGTLFAAQNPSEKMVAVLQGFSWWQEGDATPTGLCTGVTTGALPCPFPTQAQWQQMRDQALYYSWLSGHPVSYVLWYSWNDIICGNGSGTSYFVGCNATANLAALQAVDSAPFPSSPPQ